MNSYEITDENVILELLDILHTYNTRVIKQFIPYSTKGYYLVNNVTKIRKNKLKNNLHRATLLIDIKRNTIRSHEKLLRGCLWLGKKKIKFFIHNVRFMKIIKTLLFIRKSKLNNVNAYLYKKTWLNY